MDAFTGVMLAAIAASPPAPVAPHPIYKMELPCPTGVTVQSVSTDPDVIMLYLLGVTRKITPEQFKLFMLSKFPDRKGEIVEFTLKCLGADHET